MSLHDFLKDKAKAEGKTVFIRLKDDPLYLGYKVPFDDITFSEDGPLPFCSFPGGGVIAESETVVVQLSRIADFRVVVDKQSDM